MKGIVIWDARSSFVMVFEDVPGAIRIIQKKGTIFKVPVYKVVDVDSERSDEPLYFEILGSRFMYRAVDRAGRKFKAHAVEDL
jgi:ribonuclease P protein subunit POP4